MVAYEIIQYRRWALGIHPASAAESNFTDVFTVILGSALVALVVRPRPAITLSLSLSSDRGRHDMIEHSPSHFLVFFWFVWDAVYNLRYRPSTRWSSSSSSR